MKTEKQQPAHYKKDGITEDKLKDLITNIRQESASMMPENSYLKDTRAKAFLKNNFSDFAIEQVKPEITFRQLDKLLHEGVGMTKAASVKENLDTVVREMIYKGLALAFCRSTGYYHSLWKKNTPMTNVNLPDVEAINSAIKKTSNS